MYCLCQTKKDFPWNQWRKDGQQSQFQFCLCFPEKMLLKNLIELLLNFKLNQLQRWHTMANAIRFKSPQRALCSFAVTTPRSISIISTRLSIKLSERIVKQQNNQSLSSKHSKTYFKRFLHFPLMSVFWLKN